MATKRDTNGSGDSITVSDAGRPLVLFPTKLDGVVVYTTTDDETEDLRRRYERNKTNGAAIPSNRSVAATR